MINKGAGGVILPQQEDDSGQNQMQEMLAIMRAINAQKEQARKQTLDEMRLKEEQRRNRAEEYKYKKDEYNTQRALEQASEKKIESETIRIIDKKLTPSIDEQRNNWHEKTKPLLGSIKEVNAMLTLGMKDGFKTSPLFQKQGLKSIERIIERMTGATKVSVIHPVEEQSNLDAIDPFWRQWIRKWSPTLSGKKLLSKEQAQELIDALGK